MFFFRTSPTAREIRASSNPDRKIRSQTRQHRKLKQCGNSQSSVAETELTIIVIGLSGRADTWQSNAKHLYTRVCFFQSQPISPHSQRSAFKRNIHLPTVSPSLRLQPVLAITQSSHAFCCILPACMAEDKPETKSHHREWNPGRSGESQVFSKT